MTIGQRIKNRRIELNLSVDEVAEKLGKNRATVYRYEKDDIKDFPITVLEPLAKVLETTPADLMGWEYDFKDTPGKSDISPNNIDSFKRSYDKSKFRGDRLLNAIVNNAEKLDNDGKKSLLDYSYFLLEQTEQKNNMLKFQLDLQTNAASQRTDIDIPEGTDTSEDDIMDSRDF